MQDSKSIRPSYSARKFWPWQDWDHFQIQCHNASLNSCPHHLKLQESNVNDKSTIQRVGCFTTYLRALHSDLMVSRSRVKDFMEAERPWTLTHQNSYLSTLDSWYENLQKNTTFCDKYKYIYIYNMLKMLKMSMFNFNCFDTPDVLRSSGSLQQLQYWPPASSRSFLPAVAFGFGHFVEGQVSDMVKMWGWCTKCLHLISRT